jgi:hypothetical protein
VRAGAFSAALLLLVPAPSATHPDAAKHDETCRASHGPARSSHAPPTSIRDQLGVLRRARRSFDRLSGSALSIPPIQSVDARYVRRLDAHRAAPRLYLLPGVLRSRERLVPARCARDQSRESLRRLRQRNERVRRRHYALCLLALERRTGVCRQVRPVYHLFSPFNLLATGVGGHGGRLGGFLFYDLVPDVVARVEVTLANGQTKTTVPVENAWRLTDFTRLPAGENNFPPRAVRWLAADGSEIAAHIFR